VSGRLSFAARLTSPFCSNINRPRALLSGSGAAAIVSTGVLLTFGMTACGTGTSVPRPMLSSVTPDSVVAGSGSPTVLISGSNFLATSSVEWNGLARATTFSSPTELQVQLELLDVAYAGLSAITVVNPEGGGTSNAGVFTVDNALPVLNSLSPSSVVYLTISSPLDLTLSGSGFGPNSVALWNAVSLPTTYVSATELTVQVSPSLLASAGNFAITVVQPAPGGGTSQALTFSIAAPETHSMVEIAQVANDLAWDSSAEVIYLSVSSTAATYQNSVAVLDPDAGTIVASQFTGNEPSRLAISDGNQFLYVGLNGASSVQRLALPSLSPSVEYSLGTSSSYGPYFALDLQVAPGMAHTTAVSLGAAGVDPEAEGGVAIFDDATQRPSVAPGFIGGGLYDSLQWGADATNVYAGNSEDTAFDFYDLEVTSQGVAGVIDYRGGVRHSGDFIGRIHFDPVTQLVYVDNGIVLDPVAGRPVGAFAAAGWMVPDPSLGRAFFLTSPATSGLLVTIHVFDLTHFTRIASVPLEGVKGNPLQFIRWGTRGLAFCTDAGYVYLVSGGFVDGSE